MVVIKMSDQEEKFSLEKLARSISAANADTNEPIDLEMIMAEFQNLIVDNEYVTTGQIKIIVYGLLYSKKAMNTLKNYAEFKEQ